MTQIDGFNDVQPAPKKQELDVEIGYENFVTQLQGRMSQVFTDLMTENAEIRAQAWQLKHERDAARAETEAAKAALKEFMTEKDAGA